MIFRKALPIEYEAVVDFYYKLIDDIEDFEYSAAWVKDIYPDRALFSEAFDKEEMFIALEDDEIIGAVRINDGFDDEYEGVPWKCDAKASEACAVHILAVRADMMNRGIAKKIVKEIILLSKEKGKKAIRLEVLPGNVPAEKLYLGCGFYFVKTINAYYEDTGWHDFDLYEYDLSVDQK